MFIIRILLIILFLSILNYVVITTIVDIVLMGALYMYYSRKLGFSKFIITKSNRIDFQSAYKCSAFSTAYMFRHWGIEKNGDDLYEIMPSKIKNRKETFS